MVKAVKGGDILQVEWLVGPVLKVLVLEAQIIRSDPEDVSSVALANIKRTIDLEDYNKALKKHLTAAQYRRLRELRAKYSYARYVEHGSKQ